MTPCRAPNHREDPRGRASGWPRSGRLAPRLLPHDGVADRMTLGAPTGHGPARQFTSSSTSPGPPDRMQPKAQVAAIHSIHVVTPSMPDDGMRPGGRHRRTLGANENSQQYSTLNLRTFRANVNLGSRAETDGRPPRVWRNSTHHSWRACAESPGRLGITADRWAAPIALPMEIPEGHSPVPGPADTPPAIPMVSCAAWGTGFRPVMRGRRTSPAMPEAPRGPIVACRQRAARQDGRARPSGTTGVAS